MTALLLADLVVATGAGFSIRAIALYCCVIVGCCLSILWRPTIGLYLLTLLLPLQTTRYHLHDFPLGANIVDILLACTILGAVIRSKLDLVRRPFVLTLLALMGGFYYLSLWRGAFYLSYPLPIWFNDQRLVDYKNFMVMPMLSLAALLVVRTRHQIAIIIVICAITAVAVDYSYFKSSIGRDFNHYSEETRDAGPLGYAGENGLASYLVEIGTCLVPLIAMKRAASVKLPLLLAIAAVVCCILYSYSREAYLALVVSLVFIAVVRMRWLLGPLVLFAFTWQLVVPTAVSERIMMTYTQSGSGTGAELDASAQERVGLWTDAMELFRENPIVGTGFLTYANMNRVGNYRDTHNFYLKMLVETGLIGLGLFLLQLLLFFREGVLLFRRSDDSFLSLVGLGFSALILSAAVVNIFGDRWMFIQVSSNMWILLGCVIRANSMKTAPMLATELAKHPEVWAYVGTDEAPCHGFPIPSDRSKRHHNCKPN